MIIFSNRFLLTNLCKLLTKPNPTYVGFLRAYLGRSLKPMAQNYKIVSISFFNFIMGLNENYKSYKITCLPFPVRGIAVTISPVC